MGGSSHLSITAVNRLIKRSFGEDVRTMKLFYFAFVGLIESFCEYRSGGHGEMVKCPNRTYLAAFCSSGENKDCCNGIWGSSSGSGSEHSLGPHKKVEGRCEVEVATRRTQQYPGSEGDHDSCKIGFFSSGGMGEEEFDDQRHSSHYQFMFSWALRDGPQIMYVSITASVPVWTNYTLS